MPITEQTEKRFPSMAAMSFDKGFHSPANQAGLKERDVFHLVPT